MRKNTAKIRQESRAGKVESPKSVFLSRETGWDAMKHVADCHRNVERYHGKMKMIGDYSLLFEFLS